VESVKARFSYRISNNDIKQATTNTGVLHCVQDDDVKQTTANATAIATANATAIATAIATATADPYGMTNKGTSNGNCKNKYGDPSLRSG
jgi:hypothetical protein